MPRPYMGRTRSMIPPVTAVCGSRTRDPYMCLNLDSNRGESNLSRPANKGQEHAREAQQ